MTFPFYQRSGIYIIRFDFADYARENLFMEDVDVAENFLADMMRQAGIERSIIDALPSLIPDDVFTYKGNVVENPNHHAAWCYRLGSKLEGRKVPSEFWRLVLELPDVHGSDIQPIAEIALGACVEQERLAKYADEPKGGNHVFNN